MAKPESVSGAGCRITFYCNIEFSPILEAERAFFHSHLSSIRWEERPALGDNKLHGWAFF
jgi:hypothetical protein